MQERLEAELSLTNILFGGGRGLEDLMSRDLEALLGEEDTLGEEAIPEDVENKYLTLSWWLLHVGWKDVGERVRRGVEEVFEGCVSVLSSQLLTNPAQCIIKDKAEYHGPSPTHSGRSTTRRTRNHIRRYRAPHQVSLYSVPRTTHL